MDLRFACGAVVVLLAASLSGLGCLPRAGAGDAPSVQRLSSPLDAVRDQPVAVLPVRAQKFTTAAKKRVREVVGTLGGVGTEGIIMKAQENMTPAPGSLSASVGDPFPAFRSAVQAAFARQLHTSFVEVATAPKPLPDGRPPIGSHRFLLRVVSRGYGLAYGALDHQSPFFAVSVQLEDTYVGQQLVNVSCDREGGLLSKEDVAHPAARGIVQGEIERLRHRCEHDVEAALCRLANPRLGATVCVSAEDADDAD